jgi:hypothetical protein
VARGGRGFEERQERRVAHAHAAGAGHLGRVMMTGTGLPAILRVGRHGEDGIDGAGLEQALGEPRGDAGPLRALARRPESGAVHRAVGAEEALLGR